MPTPPRRRYFRFGLRTMFVMLTVVGVGSAALLWKRNVSDFDQSRPPSRGVFIEFYDP